MTQAESEDLAVDHLEVMTDQQVDPDRLTIWSQDELDGDTPLYIADTI